jgi:hypothetical protein
MRARHVFAAICGIALAFIGVSANAATVSSVPALLLQGPVDSVNRSRAQIGVLGHTLAVNQTVSLSLGTQVAVYGWLSRDGQLIVQRVQLLGQYVPGASRVVISGRVSRINSATGRVAIGGVSVDYTPLLSAAPTLRLATNSLARFAGTQAQFRGLITASLAEADNQPTSDVALALSSEGLSPVAVDAGRTDGVITGANGIIIGTNGIITGTNGIITGTNGIITGTNGIITGTNGIITGTN